MLIRFEIRLILLCMIIAGQTEARRGKRNTIDERENAVTIRCQPQDDFVRTQFDRSDWMFSQRTRLSSTRLIDLKMIGTHNSASYSINELFDEYSVCQNSQINTQLMAGARYLDIRVGSYSGPGPRLRVGHGPHAGAPFLDILNEIKNFTISHPKEFLIISIKDTKWGTISPTDKYEIFQIIKSVFSDFLITSEDDWFNLGTVDMGSIWNHNRSILLLYHEPLLLTLDSGDGRVFNVTREEAMKIGFMPRDSLIYDPWANTDNIDTLFEKLDVYYQTREGDKERLHVSQFVLTSIPLGTDGIDGLTAQLQNSGRIKQWLIENNAYNIALLDFLVGVTSQERTEAVELLDFIISQGSQIGNSTGPSR